MDAGWLIWIVVFVLLLWLLHRVSGFKRKITGRDSANGAASIGGGASANSCDAGGGADGGGC